MAEVRRTTGHGPRVYPPAQSMSTPAPDRADATPSEKVHASACVDACLRYTTGASKVWEAAVGAE
eukprot:6301049-Amphidinium_carterae.1